MSKVMSSSESESEPFSASESEYEPEVSGPSDSSITGNCFLFQ